MFVCTYNKLVELMGKQSNMDFIKACRIFDPVQLPTLNTDMSLYYSIPALQPGDCTVSNNRLLDEWSVYVKGSYPQASEGEFDLMRFWEGMKSRVTMLAVIARYCQKSFNIGV